MFSTNLEPLLTTGARVVGWLITRNACLRRTDDGPYDEYRMWYVPSDIMAFADELGMAMAAPLGSRANVCVFFEMLEVI